MESSISLDVWYTRIKESREYVDLYAQRWQQNASLLTNAFTIKKAGNETDSVVLPSGDQVKMSLIFRNLEQTFALLDMAEIGVSAQAVDFTRELGRGDSHREQVVEQGLWQSMMFSGMINKEEVGDAIKWDASICGHAVCFSAWRIETDEVESSPALQFRESDDGFMEQVFDEFGAPVLKTRMQDVVSWEGVQDRRISPLDHLFDTQAESLEMARWSGFEEVVALQDLKDDESMSVPEDVKASGFERRTLQGNDPVDTSEDSVRRIVVYDKRNRELLYFMEYNTHDAKQTSRDKLHLLKVVKNPFEVDHPDDSPFNYYVPQPANDHPLGIDQIEHIRNQSIEADKLRTRAANLTRQLKLLLLYKKKGGITQEELEKAWTSTDNKPIGLNMSDEDSWDDMIKEIKLGGVPKEIYDHVAMAEDDVRKTTGISEVPFGGADTATESENQMSIGGARPRRKSRKFLKFLGGVAQTHKNFLQTYAPQGQTIPVFTADGLSLNLPYGREAFYGKFLLTVTTAGGVYAVTPVKMKMFNETFDRVFGRFGPKFDLIMLRKMLDMHDVRDKNQLMLAAQEAFGLGQYAPQPQPGGFIPGQAAPPNLNDLSPGQTIRGAINSIAES